MKKYYCERRDDHGNVVERVGPFDGDNHDGLTLAIEHQIQIADAHNRVRPPGSFGGAGRQAVYTVEEE